MSDTPARESTRKLLLERLLQQTTTLSLRQAEELLGLDRQWIMAELDPALKLRNGSRLPWNEVAELMLRVVPPATLDELIGTSSFYPALLRVTDVRWRIPAYLIIALERVVAEARARDRGAKHLTTEALVARILDETLDPDLMDALCADPLFAEAYKFPR